MSTVNLFCIYKIRTSQLTSYLIIVFLLDGRVNQQCGAFVCLSLSFIQVKSSLRLKSSQHIHHIIIFSTDRWTQKCGSFATTVIKNSYTDQNSDSLTPLKWASAPHHNHCNLQWTLFDLRAGPDDTVNLTRLYKGRGFTHSSFIIDASCLWWLKIRINHNS